MITGRGQGTRRQHEASGMRHEARGARQKDTRQVYGNAGSQARREEGRKGGRHRLGGAGAGAGLHGSKAMHKASNGALVAAMQQQQQQVRHATTTTTTTRRGKVARQQGSGIFGGSRREEGLWQVGGRGREHFDFGCDGDAVKFRRLHMHTH